MLPFQPMQILLGTTAMGEDRERQQRWAGSMFSRSSAKASYFSSTKSRSRRDPSLSLSSGCEGFNYRPVRPNWSETGRYRWNLNLNLNGAVQPVRTGIPIG